MCVITKNKSIIIRELKEGHVVVVPTDTVYGLAALISSEEAIRNIFTIKRRPITQPLSISVKDIKAINDVVQHIPPSAQEMINRDLPGPWTIILEKKQIISDLITSGSRYVGVRVPNNALLLDILSSIAVPIVLTSANIHGSKDCVTAKEVERQLGNAIEYILDGGECSIGSPSAIISFINDKKEIIRPGGFNNTNTNN